MDAHLILAVDEEAATRQALIDVLSLDGHEVDGAGDADSALLLLDQRRYDLVIADVRMPKLDGPALLDALAERFGAAPPRSSSSRASPSIRTTGASSPICGRPCSRSRSSPAGCSSW